MHLIPICLRTMGGTTRRRNLYGKGEEGEEATFLEVQNRHSHDKQYNEAVAEKTKCCGNPGQSTKTAKEQEGAGTGQFPAEKNVMVKAA